MASELYDCSWCGSARSIEHGLCQVCLMEYPVDTQVIALPAQRPPAERPPAERRQPRTTAPAPAPEAAEAD